MPADFDPSQPFSVIDSAIAGVPPANPSVIDTAVAPPVPVAPVTPEVPMPAAPEFDPAQPFTPLPEPKDIPAFNPKAEFQKVFTVDDLKTLPLDQLDKEKEFEPTDFGLQHEAELNADPEAKAKLLELYRIRNQPFHSTQQFLAQSPGAIATDVVKGIASAPGTVLSKGFHLFKDIAGDVVQFVKNINTGLPGGVQAFRILKSIPGGPAAINAELNRTAGAAAEIPASVETAANRTTGFLKNSARTVGETGAAIPGPIGQFTRDVTGAKSVSEYTPEELKARFESDVSQKRATQDAARGAGTMMQAIGLGEQELKDANIQIRPDVVQKLSTVTDPLNLILLGEGAAVGAVGKVGGRFVVEEIAKAGSIEQASAFVRAVNEGSQLAGRAVRATGEGLETAGGALREKVFKPLHNLGDVSAVLAGTGGHLGVGAGIAAVTKLTPKALELAGRGLKAAAPFTAGAVRVGADVAGEFAKGYAHGLLYTAPFMVGADPTERDALLSAAALGGVVRGGVRGVGLGGQIAGFKAQELLAKKIFEHVKQSEPPTVPDYGTDLTLDSQSRVNTANLSEPQRKLLGWAKNFTGPAVEWYPTTDTQFMQQTGGVGGRGFAIKLGQTIAPDGSVKPLVRIFLNGEVDTMAHEMLHALGELDAPGYRDFVKSANDTLTTSEREMFTQIYNTVHNGGLPEAQWTRRLTPERISNEVAAEIFSRVVLGQDLSGVKPSLVRKAALFASNILEKMGVPLGDVNPAQAKDFKSKEAPRPGYSTLGLRPSAKAVTVGNEFFQNLIRHLKESGDISGPPEPSLLQTETGPTTVTSPNAVTRRYRGTPPAPPAGPGPGPAPAPTPAGGPAAPAAPSAGPAPAPAPAPARKPGAPVYAPHEIDTLPGEPLDLGAGDYIIQKGTDPAVIVRGSGPRSTVPTVLPSGPAGPKPRNIRTTEKAQNDFTAARHADTKIDAAKVAAEATGNPDVVKHVEDISKAVETGTPLEIEYQSVKNAGGAEAPTSRNPRRTEQENAYIAEAMGALPEDVRELAQKITVPVRWETVAGKPQLLAMSLDKVIANVHKVAKEAAAHSVEAKIPYDIREGTLTPEAWRSVVDDFQSYAENQANGFRGDGGKLTRPTEDIGVSIPPENPDYSPRHLRPEKANFLNMVQGLNPPLTAREVKGATPGNVKGQILAEINLKQPQKPAVIGDIKKQTFKTSGREIMEMNPLRNELAAAGVPVRSLIEVTERLSTENIEKVTPRPDIQLKAPVTDTIRGGFLPGGENVSKLGADILKDSETEWIDRTRGFQGGLTGGAYRLGQGLTKIEDVQTLRDLAAQAKATYEAARAAKDFDAMSPAASKLQFFNEALEAATGSSPSKREAIGRVLGPDWQPPFPETKGQLLPGNRSVKEIIESLPKGSDYLFGSHKKTPQLIGELMSLSPGFFQDVADTHLSSAQNRIWVLKNGGEGALRRAIQRLDDQDFVTLAEGRAPEDEVVLARNLVSLWQQDVHPNARGNPEIEGLVPGEGSIRLPTPKGGPFGMFKTEVPQKGVPETPKLSLAGTGFETHKEMVSEMLSGDLNVPENPLFRQEDTPSAILKKNPDLSLEDRKNLRVAFEEQRADRLQVASILDGERVEYSNYGLPTGVESTTGGNLKLLENSLGNFAEKLFQRNEFPTREAAYEWVRDTAGQILASKNVFRWASGFYRDLSPGEKIRARLKGFAKAAIRRVGGNFLPASDFSAGLDPIKEAAILTKGGHVITGSWHGEALDKLIQMAAKGELPEKFRATLNPEEPESAYDKGELTDGFVTASGKFLDRKEAYDHAEAIKQLDTSKVSSTIRRNRYLESQDFKGARNFLPKGKEINPEDVERLKNTYISEVNHQFTVQVPTAYAAAFSKTLTREDLTKPGASSTDVTLRVVSPNGKEKTFGPFYNPDRVVRQIQHAVGVKDVVEQSEIGFFNSENFPTPITSEEAAKAMNEGKIIEEKLVAGRDVMGPAWLFRDGKALEGDSGMYHDDAVDGLNAAGVVDARSPEQFQSETGAVRLGTFASARHIGDYGNAELGISLSRKLSGAQRNEILTLLKGQVDADNPYFSRVAVDITKSDGSIYSGRIFEYPSQRGALARFLNDPFSEEFSAPKTGGKLLPGGETDKALRSGLLPDRKVPVRETDKELADIAEQVATTAGIDYNPSREYVAISPDLSKRLANFYDKAKSDPTNPEVAASYAALSDETMKQYRALEKAGYVIVPFTGQGEPYKNSAEAVADVRDNKHLFVLLTAGNFEGEKNNPMLAPSGVEGLPTINDVFRGVHDVFGHAKEGYQFGPRGEFNAWRAHSEMYSPEAQGALAAETLAQNSWVNFGAHLEGKGEVPLPERPFAEQKAVVVPQELIDEARGVFLPKKKNEQEPLKLSPADIKRKAAPGAIKSAAVRLDNGAVIEAPIHASAIMKALEQAPGYQGGFEDGFTTNKGEFLDRKEALVRAEDIKQLKPFTGLAKQFGALETTEFEKNRKFLPARREKRDDEGRPLTSEGLVDYEKLYKEKVAEEKSQKAAPTDYSKYAAAPSAKNAGESTGWILPDKSFVSIGTGFHEQYLADNAAALNKKFGTKFSSKPDPEERLAALNAGFVRIRGGLQGERRTAGPGGVVVEVNARHFRKARPVLENYLLNRADSTDRLSLSLLNDKGNVIDSASADVHELEGAERADALLNVVDSVRKPGGQLLPGGAPADLIRAEAEAHVAAQRLEEKFSALAKARRGLPFGSPERNKLVEEGGDIGDQIELAWRAATSATARRLEANIPVSEVVKEMARLKGSLLPGGEDILPGLNIPSEEKAKQLRVKARISNSQEKFPEALKLSYQKDENGKFILGDDGKPKPQTVEYGLADSPLGREAAKGLKGEDRIRAVESALGDKLIREGRAALKRPDLQAGAKWYSTARTRLKGLFGDDSKFFTELLGATSARTPVEVNYRFALDAYNQFKQGKYDAQIRKYREGKANWESGQIQPFLEESGNENPTRGQYLDWWVEKNDLGPVQSNGKKFGANSRQVLKVLDGSWAEEIGGPKTPNFAGNLAGTTFEATIDVWAARMLHRLANEGNEKPWRILPENETGVTDEDFNIGQAAYRRAAEKLKMKPDALQAVLWFSEKDYWERRGWTRGAGAEKSDFNVLLKETEPAAGGTFKMKTAQQALAFDLKPGDIVVRKK